MFAAYAKAWRALFIIFSPEILIIFRCASSRQRSETAAASNFHMAQMQPRMTFGKAAAVRAQIGGHDRIASLVQKVEA
jgi:hypothetical protein